jgi:hypothetical protein
MEIHAKVVAHVISRPDPKSLHLRMRTAPETVLYSGKTTVKYLSAHITEKPVKVFIDGRPAVVMVQKMNPVAFSAKKMPTVAAVQKSKAPVAARVDQATSIVKSKAMTAQHRQVRAHPDSQALALNLKQAPPVVKIPSGDQPVKHRDSEGGQRANFEMANKIILPKQDELFLG